jgi:hypothetical protein
VGKLGDAAKKINPSSGMFIKFTDGAEFTVRLLSDPWIRSTRYEDTKKLDENGQPTITVKTNFVWPVWDYADESVRILEQGASVANQIDAIDDKWKNNGAMPPNYDLNISAKGEMLQRRYTVVPMPQQGTMPVSSSLQMPDYTRQPFADAIPLKDFLAGTEPEVKDTPKSTALENLSDDVVIQDLDTSQEVNLDEIPF